MNPIFNYLTPNVTKKEVVYEPLQRMLLEGENNFWKVIFGGLVILGLALALGYYTVVQHLSQDSYTWGIILTILTLIILFIAFGTLKNARSPGYYKCILEFTPEGIRSNEGRHPDQDEFLPIAGIKSFHIIEEYGVYDFYLNGTDKPDFGIRPENGAYRSSPQTFVDFVSLCLKYHTVAKDQINSSTRYTLRPLAQPAGTGDTDHSVSDYGRFKYFTFQRQENGTMVLSEKNPNVGSGKLVIDLERGGFRKVRTLLSDDVYEREQIKRFTISDVKTTVRKGESTSHFAQVSVVTQHGRTTVLRLRVPQKGDGRQQVFRIREEIKEVAEVLGRLTKAGGLALEKGE